MQYKITTKMVGYKEFKNFELHWDLYSWALPLSFQYSQDTNIVFVQVLFITLIIL